LITLGTLVTPNLRHFLPVRFAIYVAYPRPMYYTMQHKESIPEHLLPNKNDKLLKRLNSTYRVWQQITALYTGN
jgi:hypothetical protein